MKKSLFMMGAALLALASCTNEETVNIPSTRGIAFGSPYVGITTKAATVTITDLTALQTQGAGFYVWGGYQSVPQVFADTHVTYAGGTWGYEPTSYWVIDENYKFLAYAPEMGVTPTYAWGTSTDANDATLIFTGVTVDGTADNQKDFVIGKSGVITGAASNNPNVSITMKHALAMVKVTLTNGFRTSAKLQISNFAINGIKTTGTFTQHATVVDQAGQWVASNAESQSTFTDAGFTLDTNGETYANEFIVIPQGTENVTVTFTGTLTDESGQPVEVPDGTGDGKNVKDFTIKITNMTWEINKRYNYTATIDGNTFGMNEIIFGAPTIDTWGSYTDTPVNIE